MTTTDHSVTPSEWPFHQQPTERRTYQGTWYPSLTVSTSTNRLVRVHDRVSTSLTFALSRKPPPPSPPDGRTGRTGRARRWNRRRLILPSGQRTETPGEQPSKSWSTAVHPIYHHLHPSDLRKSQGRWILPILGPATKRMVLLKTDHSGRLKQRSWKWVRSGPTRVPKGVTAAGGGCAPSKRSCGGLKHLNARSDSFSNIYQQR